MFIDDLLKFLELAKESSLNVPVNINRAGRKILNKREHGISARKNYTAFFNELNDINTKRILFDSQQASLFGQISNETPNFSSKIQMPFETFYLEFTHPVCLPFQQPGYKDYLRGILVKKMEVDDEYLMTFFLTSFNEVDTSSDEFVDRSWYFKFNSKEMIRKQESYDQWWLDYVSNGLNFFYWILLYMMCKSVKIQEEKLTRQMKRNFERKSIIPKPWHKVILEPKYYKSNRNKLDQSSYKQTFRYDVIGHLRFNRHKTKNGWREVVEWIPAHQRGLDNELYIPKTYQVNKGKEVSGKMNKYFNE